MWYEFNLKSEAYWRQQEEEWRRTRLIAYTIYCTSVESSKREEIYDFMPLPGDPSKSKRIKMQESQQVSYAKKLVKLYKSKGLI